MKLSDFIVLDEKQKKLAVLHRGVLIAKRKDASRIFFLFQMNHFYVETSGDLQTKGIEEFKMFDHPGLLQPYLEEIAIDDLLN